MALSPEILEEIRRYGETYEKALVAGLREYSDAAQEKEHDRIQEPRRD